MLNFITKCFIMDHSHHIVMLGALRVECIFIFMKICDDDFYVIILTGCSINSVHTLICYKI